MSKDLFYDPPKVNDDKLAEIIKQTQYLDELKKYYDLEKDRLASIASEIFALENTTIPAAMAEIGLNEFGLPDGTRVSLIDKYEVKMPKETAKRGKVFSTLEEIGAGDIIQTDVVMSFGKSEHNAAIDIYEQLLGSGFHPNMSSNVHAATYRSFMIDAFKTGVSISFPEMGFKAWRSVEFKQPKRK